MADEERRFEALFAALIAKFGREPRLRIYRTLRPLMIELVDRDTTFRVRVRPETPGNLTSRLVSEVVGPTGLDDPHLDGLGRRSIFTLDGMDRASQQVIAWIAKSYDELYAEWSRRLADLRSAAEERVSRRRADEQAASERLAAARAAEREEWARVQEDRRGLAEARAREEAERAAAHAKRRQVVIARLDEAIRTAFLTPEPLLSQEIVAELLPGDVDDRRAAFVASWARKRNNLVLDDEQALAAASVTGNVQVTARAGSGKTSVLIAHALVLQELLGELPDSILVLAFNRKAAEQAKLCLKEHVRVMPQVMDFHALAYTVVQPDENLLVDDHQTGADSRSRAIQGLIDTEMARPSFRETVLNLMLTSFSDDVEDRVIGRVSREAEGVRAFRPSLPLETFDGTPVKSRGERLIANTLFEWSVDYQYEQNHFWKGQTYRPDFTVPLPGVGLIIEYFGLAGDPRYDEQSAQKRAYWIEKPGWKLLEYTPAAFRRGSAAFAERLVADLGAEGVPLRRRSQEELLAHVEKRATTSFARTVAGFIKRCRSRGFDTAQLRARIADHVSLTDAEAAFLSVVPVLLDRYIEMLTATHQIDFDGLLARAVHIIHSGRTTFTRGSASRPIDLAQIRHVLVDEFQDLSEPLYGLLKAIQTASPAVRFFCVGDDWQSIYSFTGADPRSFDEFETLFGPAVHRRIRTNYRSAEAIVKASNEVMRDPRAVTARDGATRGEAWLCPIDEFHATRLQEREYGPDKVTPAVLGVIRHMLADGGTVTLLSRRDDVLRPPRSDGTRRMNIRDYVTLLRQALRPNERDRIRGFTVHGYKGLESDGVIVLDATCRSFPLIHPSWVFLRVLGTSIGDIVEEERRLFYVALTRAKRSVCVVTERAAMTPYLQPLVASGAFTNVPDGVVARGGPSEGRYVEVQVQTSYGSAPTLELKLRGYAWDRLGRYWWRILPMTDFSPPTLMAESWTASCQRITACTTAGEILHDWRGVGVAPPDLSSGL